jgi:hypothetical protein
MPEFDTYVVNLFDIIALKIAKLKLSESSSSMSLLRISIYMDDRRSPSQVFDVMLLLLLWFVGNKLGICD